MNAIVLFCGSRIYCDRESIAARINAYASMPYEELLILHGGAPGADSLAGEIALEQQINSMCMPAKWRTLGRTAGPIRNVTMLDVLKTYRAAGWYTAVEAFPIESSIGTRHMIKISLAAGFPVNVW